MSAGDNYFLFLPERNKIKNNYFPADIEDLEEAPPTEIFSHPQYADRKNISTHDPLNRKTYLIIHW